MKIINPATEEEREIELTEISSITTKVEIAREAQKAWGELPASERVVAIRRFIEIAKENKELLATTIKTDMGKPISAANGEIIGALTLAEIYCSNTEKWLAPEPYENGHTVHEPLGVIGVITPWNYPFYVALTGMIPALLAGNGIVFKPSEYTLSSGIELVKIFEQVLPEGLIQLVVGGKDHGKAVVESDVDMIAFTGSTIAGKDIMEKCAKEVKRVHLELGGMDAAIVLGDADIEAAAEGIVRANCTNSGQICCAAKRAYVDEEIFERFVEAAAKVSSEITFGSPDTEVDMGPLVAKFQLDKVASIVDDAREKGATIHTGGEKVEGKGYYYPSTVVSNVTEDMRVLTEEPFGPVLPVIPIKNWEEGVQAANSSPYGLTGSVWTKDINGLGTRVANKLEVGQVGINAHASPPLGAPFGGAKQSGIGRTENREGMVCYCNTKFIYAGSS